MKSVSLLLLSLILVGAGCTTTVATNDVYDTATDADTTMMVPAEDGEGVPEMIAVGEGEMMEGAEKEDTTEASSEMVKDDSAQKPEDTSTKSEVAQDAVVFDVDGFMFGYKPNVLRVKKGQTVTVNMTSTGGLHDWVVDAFNARTEKVNTDGKTSVTFVADQAGSFEFYCSVGQHRANGMVGTLIVE